MLLVKLRKEAGFIVVSTKTIIDVIEDVVKSFTTPAEPIFLISSLIEGLYGRI
jgi:hypothetical protein